MLCVPCGEGLKCPFASSIQTLQSGGGQNGDESKPGLKWCTQRFVCICTPNLALEDNPLWVSNSFLVEHLYGLLRLLSDTITVIEFMTHFTHFNMNISHSSRKQDYNLDLDFDFNSKVTRIRKGYFATPADPLQIFHCRPDSWCPGGTPGLFEKRKLKSFAQSIQCVTNAISRVFSQFRLSRYVRTKLAGTCAGNFEGMLCDSCPVGKSHASGECDDCGATWVGWIVGLLVYLTAVPRIYYFVNNKATWLQQQRFFCNCDTTHIVFRAPNCKFCFLLRMPKNRHLESTIPFSTFESHGFGVKHVKHHSRHFGGIRRYRQTICICIYIYMYMSKESIFVIDSVIIYRTFSRFFTWASWGHSACLAL